MTNVISYSFGPVHFPLKGYWVVFFIFVQILLENYVIKWWRRGVWSGSALPVYIPLKRCYAYMV